MLRYLQSLSLNCWLNDCSMLLYCIGTECSWASGLNHILMGRVVFLWDQLLCIRSQIWCQLFDVELIKLNNLTYVSSLRSINFEPMMPITRKSMLNSSFRFAACILQKFGMNLKKPSRVLTFLNGPRNPSHVGWIYVWELALLHHFKCPI